jgi:hypothetical protein
MSAGTYFVYGPPGTGPRKTTYLARQAQRAVTEHGNDSVVIASLTRAAAAEIAGRDTGIPDPTRRHPAPPRLPGAQGTARPRRQDLGRRNPRRHQSLERAHPHQAISRGTNQLEDVIDTAGDGAGDDIHHQVTTLRARMTPREEWTLQQRAHDADWTRFKERPAGWTTPT